MEPVRVRIEECADEPRSATETQLDDSGFVDFVASGAPVAGDYRCADCGYGAVVHSVLPPCPMCGGTVWESRGPLPRRLVD